MRGRIAAALVLTAGALAAQPFGTADPYQRSAEIYGMRTVAANGPGRGEEIYYFKCWICHNKYAQAGGPHLKGLFERPKLLSGQPVTDENVRNKIRTGGPGMPAYGHTLTEADQADLLLQGPELLLRR
jgi:mono/diheme cytochrome c family protein